MTTNASPATAKAQAFKLRTALLSEGRTHHILAATNNEAAGMNVAIKCYAGGGENAFHTHAQEDHVFVVLQGRATFYAPDEAPKTLGRNEGILLPRNAFYKFEADPSEPLVLLRVGNVHRPVGGTGADDTERFAPDGSPLPGHSIANGHVDGVPIPGAFFE